MEKLFDGLVINFANQNTDTILDCIKVLDIIENFDCNIFNYREVVSQLKEIGCETAKDCPRNYKTVGDEIHHGDIGFAADCFQNMMAGAWDNFSYTCEKIYGGGEKSWYHLWKSAVCTARIPNGQKIIFNNYIWDSCPIQGQDLNDLIQACNNIVERISKFPYFFNEFKKAPAAKAHHQNYEGGLIEHSFKLACYLYSRVLKIGGFTVDQVARVAMCHDFCKIGLYQLQSDGNYTYDKEKIKHHGLASVAYADLMSIALSQGERICVLLHMAGGWWNAEDENDLSLADRLWIGQNIQLLSAVQWADMKACE